MFLILGQTDDRVRSTKLGRMDV